MPSRRGVGWLPPDQRRERGGLQDSEESETAMENPRKPSRSFPDCGTTVSVESEFALLLRGFLMKRSRRLGGDNRRFVLPLSLFNSI